MRGEPAALALDPDHVALAAACEPGTALCTVVAVDGPFPRRVGAQLAIRPDGSTAGDLADHCLERQLVADLRRAGGPEVRRYGKGSPSIDFRLPCGGGLDILLDPAPDREAAGRALHDLLARRPARLRLADGSHRAFRPALRLRLVGQGPEMAALQGLCRQSGVEVETVESLALSFGRPSGLARADGWTAVLLLFHDHDWEIALIEEALASDAFYVGARGSRAAHDRRLAALAARGVAVDDRLRGPVGVLPSSRSPRLFALSALTEIMARHDALGGDG